MANKKKNRSTLIISIILLLTIVGFYSYKKYPVTTPNINLINTSSGTVKLFGSPNPVKGYPNNPITIDISADPTSSYLSAVELELTYDNQLIAQPSFTTNSYIPNIVVSPTVTSGNLYTVLGAPIESGGRNTPGIIGTLTITPTRAGNHTISFGARTQVAVVNSNTNALVEANSIKLNILYPGDFDQNGIVNLLDYNVLVSNFGNPYNIFDFNSLVTNYNKSITL